MVLKSVLAVLLSLVLSPASIVHASAPALSPAQEVEALVHAAADKIKAEGEAAFPEFRKKGSRWNKAERYIFIFDEKGLELVNSGFPEIEGKNLWDLRDNLGRFVLREQVALIKTKGSGWIEVLWAKPGQSRQVKCRTYLRGVTAGGRLLIVGAPLYLE